MQKIINNRKYYTRRSCARNYKLHVYVLHARTRFFFYAKNMTAKVRTYTHARASARGFNERETRFVAGRIVCVQFHVRIRDA